MLYTFKDIVYQDRTVLHEGEICLGIGKMTVITGESGSGKSSLMREIIDHPDRFDQQLNIFDHISLEPQTPLYLDGLTIKDHIKMIGSLSDQMIDSEDYIRRLKLDHLLDMTWNQLSGGEQKRAGFLLCILKQADLYILDEPTASVNEEFSMVIAEIINEMKKDDKSFLVFTHDDIVKSQADLHYHIDNARLTCVKEEVNESELKTDHKNYKDLKVFPAYLRKMKKKAKPYRKVIDLILLILIAVIALTGGIYGMIYSAQQKILNSSYSNQLIVYKPEVQDKFWYDESVGNPLSQEDVKAIESLDHISSVIWRYDTLIPLSYENYDFLDINAHDEYANCNEERSTDSPFTIYENNEIVGTINLKDQFGVDEYDQPVYKRYMISTYSDDQKIGKEIVEQYSDDGIYITREMKKELEETFDIVIDSAHSYEIEFRFPIPVLNDYGYFVSQVEDQDPFVSWSNRCVLDTLRLPVSGVIGNYDFEKRIGNDGKRILIPQSVVKTKVEEFKREGYTAYIQSEKYADDMDMYFTTISKEKADNGFAYTKFDCYSWQPTGYTVEIDGIENIPETVDALKEMGYGVLSDYVNAEAISKGVYAMKDTFLYCTILLCLIISVSCAALEILKKSEKERMIGYFKMIGFDLNDIRTVFKKNCLTDLLYGISADVILYVSLMKITKNPLSVWGFLLILVLQAVKSYIVPICFMER